LNLGPAIRQKGVVFNNTAEYESNEPVLSTGVYVHPSGYSYTVAPNGVWYFHNADGSPRPRERGSPAMSYSPNLVKEIQQTTQEYQSLSSPQTSTVSASQTESTSYGDPSPLPFSFAETPVEAPYRAPPLVENPLPSQSTSYVHHTHSTIGSSNIHVAFQNMSISSHTAPAPPPPPPPPPVAPPTHHVRYAATAPNMATPSYATHAHSTIQTINTPLAQSPIIPAVHYTRVADHMYVPYYAPNVKTAFEGTTYEQPPTPHLNGNCQFQVPLHQKPTEFYSMMPNGVRDTFMYPVYNPYQPATMVYPTPSCSPGSNMSSPSTSPYCYKRHTPRGGMKGQNKYGADAPLKVDTKCA
jgi:hypothetical protein